MKFFVQDYEFGKAGYEELPVARLALIPEDIEHADEVILRLHELLVRGDMSVEVEFNESRT